MSSSKGQKEGGGGGVKVEVDEERLRDAIYEILLASDLSAVTTKSLRVQLEQRLGADLASKKSVISETLNKFVEEKVVELSQSNNEAGEEEEEDFYGDAGGSDSDEDVALDTDKRATVKVKRPTSNSGFMKPLQMSTELAEWMGCSLASRTEVVKRLWAYIKANNLQNPADRREILLDDALQLIFKRNKVTMFSMNKYLAPLLKNVGDLQNGGGESASSSSSSSSSRSSSKTKSKSVGGDKKDKDKDKKKKTKAGKDDKKADKKRKSRGDEDDDGADKKKKKAKKERVESDGPRKETAFTKPLALSSELAGFLGCSSMGRTDIVKAMWAYIKSNDLQNPQDRREILLDKKLKAVFNLDSFTAFSMNKYIAQHVSPL